MRELYLDYGSTTPILPTVFEAMRPFLTHQFGNPSSAYHSWGRSAARTVNGAREQLADLLNCNSSDVIFTGSATESNNIAIQSLVRGAASNRELRRENLTHGNLRPHFITSLVEHKSVLSVIKQLEGDGLIEATYVAPDSTGMVSWTAIEKELRMNTHLVSIIAANNEIGTLNPISEIGKKCAEHGILFHTDATQWIGKLKFNVAEISADLVSGSAHKFHGPQGVGFLYLRRETTRNRIKPITWGGGQEDSLRSGTHNVAGIVGCGIAAQIAGSDLSSELEKTKVLHQTFLSRILDSTSGISLNGHPSERIPHNINLCFEGVDAESLMMKLPNIAMSSGSACLTASKSPSHVLSALGLSPEKISSSLRISFGRGISEDDILFASSELKRAYQSLRN